MKGLQELKKKHSPRKRWVSVPSRRMLNPCSTHASFVFAHKRTQFISERGSKSGQACLTIEAEGGTIHGLSKMEKGAVGDIPL